jgi:signal transduction histidine kinase/CheY-like chemotaxis protein
MRDESSWQESHLYRSVFEHSTCATVVLDEHGRVVAKNRAARELAGVDVDALFAAASAHATELATFRAELRMRGRARAELTLEAAGGVRQLVLNASAQGAHDVVMLCDATERRAMEEELRHLRRVESLGFLTASIVHDFNNLLTPIVGYSSLLEGGPGPRIAESAREIRGAAERATVLVRQMLAFVRRASRHAERVRPADVVRELGGLLTRVAGDGVELTLALDPRAGDSVVDREQLEHVLLNLAANARDAMPQGGRLTVGVANVTLGEGDCDAGHGEPSREYVAITVTDTGVGMTPEVRERVFERFFTTKEEGRGTGLGLATAHRFVMQSGGCIAVRSEENHGTAVIIYLPVAAPAPSVAVTSAPPDSTRGSETILVVEDDDAVRRVVRAILEDHGYRVFDAASGADALSLARDGAHAIHLLLVDVIMPGKGGRAVAAELSAMVPEAKVLFMSGHTDDALEGHGFDESDREPASGSLIRKAFTPQGLTRKVRDVLDGVRRGQTLAPPKAG